MNRNYFDDLVQDCSISIANALETLQCCTNPSIWTHMNVYVNQPYLQDCVDIYVV